MAEKTDSGFVTPKTNFGKTPQVQYAKGGGKKKVGGKYNSARAAQIANYVSGASGGGSGSVPFTGQF